MIGIRVEIISNEERIQLAKLPEDHIYRQCCTTSDPEGPDCGNSKVAYKIFIDGWITNRPFYVCQNCLDDYLRFGQMTMTNHPIEVLRGKEVSIYPEIECVTIRTNSMDDRTRQKELTPKVVEIKQVK